MISFRPWGIMIFFFLLFISGHTPGPFLILFDGKLSKALKVCTHASHEPCIVRRIVAWDEGCKEGRSHVEGLEIVSNLWIAGLSDDIRKQGCCSQEDIVQKRPKQREN